MDGRIDPGVHPDGQTVEFVVKRENLGFKPGNQRAGPLFQRGIAVSARIAARISDENVRTEIGLKVKS